MSKYMERGSIEGEAFTQDFFLSDFKYDTVAEK